MRNLLLLLVSFITLPVLAENAMTDAFERLSLVKQTDVSGEFEQHKKIKILKNKIISKGVFSANANGFKWQQTVPVISTIRMDKSGVHSEDHLGNISKLNNADRYIPLLQALLLQDPELLSDFLMVQRGDDSCIDLTAKAPLNQVFSSVTLCGKGTVSDIILRETAGHITEIKLSYGQTR